MSKYNKLIGDKYQELCSKLKVATAQNDYGKMEIFLDVIEKEVPKDKIPAGDKPKLAKAREAIEKAKQKESNNIFIIFITFKFFENSFHSFVVSNLPILVPRVNYNSEDSGL